MNTLPRKTRCHYCGEEIDEGTTKCPYCGEWLVAQEQQVEHVKEPPAELEVEAAEPSEPVARRRGGLSSTVIIVVLVIIAFVTNPSKTEHKSEVRTALTDCVRDYAESSLQGEDAFTSFLGNAMLSSDFLVQTIMNQFLTIEIDNYGVCSLGYIKSKENGKSKLVSIAAFGKVFMLTDFADIGKQLKENDADDASDSGN